MQSPEVHPDKRVTFRYMDPDAENVMLSAEFLKEPVSLERDTSGLWTLTTGPVIPDIYPYFFIVNGISLADPSNPSLFPNERFQRSLVDIPGDAPLIHSLQDVPHGTIHYRYYKSGSLDLIRPLVIYTPPGYSNNPDRTYPVLYLIHGMTDTEETWVKVGRVHLILDNLIARERAEPMIIVMPYANPYPALRKKDPGTEVNLLGTDLFSREMIDEIIPFIEDNYRVSKGAGYRAIAGFSLGGRQSLAAGLGHPETFSWVCAFAPAIFDRELEENFSSIYASPQTLNEKLSLLWISCGKDDRLYRSASEFIGMLEKKKIRHESFITGGGHTWMNCRLFITESVPLLFR